MYLSRENLLLVNTILELTGAAALLLGAKQISRRFNSSTGAIYAYGLAVLFLGLYSLLAFLRGGNLAVATIQLFTLYHPCVVATLLFGLKNGGLEGPVMHAIAAVLHILYWM